MRESLLRRVRQLTAQPDDADIDLILHPGSRGSSGFVTFFFYRYGELTCVAKVPRRDSGRLHAEAANLRSVAHALKDSPLKATVDRVLSVEEIDSRPVLFKSVLPGRPATQLLAADRQDEVRIVLRGGCRWILDFMAATDAEHSRDSMAKRTAARAIARSGDGADWVEIFVDSDHQFLGPTHGDLVPANLLFAETKRSGRSKLTPEVTAVVDFENFQSDGFPYADFVGFMVSVSTTALGLGRNAIEMAFLESTWLSDMIGDQVDLYCRQVGCSVLEFASLLPLYSDRALMLAGRWGMAAELDFHQELRSIVVNEQAKIVSILTK